LLKSDHLKSLRPTTDKNRESLFNILSFGKFGFELIGADILDLCCGSGAIGFEALSRGAKSVTFIDNNREHLELVKQNAAMLNLGSETEILCADAKNLSQSKKEFDLIFVDPPYTDDCAEIVENLLRKNWISEKTLVVVETRESSAMPLEVLETRKYGATSFIFLRKSDPKI
jgi:16S rRNA (guanine966-N2)-methyltransferase